MSSAKIPVPVKATGSHFYKYSSFDSHRQEWLKDIIVHHRIYIPNLTQLNDPPDGKPKFALKTEEELFKFYYSGPMGVLKRNPRMSIAEQLLEGQRLNVALKREGTDYFMRQSVRLFYKEMEGWRIYSLSKRYDNMSMWAHYGANHTGYCLECANVGPFFGSAYEVIYGPSVEFDILDSDYWNGYWFCCKGRDWRTEEEVRILVPRKSVSIVPIEPSYLTRIILHWKCQRDRSRAHSRMGKTTLTAIKSSECFF